VIPRCRPQPASPRLGRLLPVLVGACATVTVLVQAAPASAATPCWKLLLNDWYDGTISNIYPIPCYHQAIKHLPTDIKVYSSAADDINRALQQAIQRQKTTSKPVTTIEPEPTTTKQETNSSSTPTPTTGTTTTTPKKKNKGPIGKALRDITPGGADSFPLPLLILGLLAILLVLAGVGGMVWRRYQGRGGPPPAAP
jgi:hypothetical protein